MSFTQDGDEAQAPLEPPPFLDAWRVEQVRESLLEGIRGGAAGGGVSPEALSRLEDKVLDVFRRVSFLPGTPYTPGNDRERIARERREEIVVEEIVEDAPEIFAREVRQDDAHTFQREYMKTLLKDLTCPTPFQARDACQGFTAYMDAVYPHLSYACDLIDSSKYPVLKNNVKAAIAARRFRAGIDLGDGRTLLQFHENNFFAVLKKMFPRDMDKWVDLQPNMPGVGTTLFQRLAEWHDPRGEAKLVMAKEKLTEILKKGLLQNGLPERVLAIRQFQASFKKENEVVPIFPVHELFHYLCMGLTAKESWQHWKLWCLVESKEFTKRLEANLRQEDSFMDEVFKSMEKHHARWRDPKSESALIADDQDSGKKNGPRGKWSKQGRRFDQREKTQPSGDSSKEEPESTSTQAKSTDSTPSAAKEKPATPSSAKLKNITCYNCGQPGHLQYDCPQQATLATYCHDFDETCFLATDTNNVATDNLITEVTETANLVLAPDFDCSPEKTALDFTDRKDSHHGNNTELACIGDTFTDNKERFFYDQFETYKAFCIPGYQSQGWSDRRSFTSIGEDFLTSYIPHSEVPLKIDNHDIDDNEAVIDSGATSIVLNGQQHFAYITATHGELVATASSTATFPILGRGLAKLHFHDGMSTLSAVMPAILCPEARYNLLAVECLCKAGFELHFDDAGGTMVHKRDNTIIHFRRRGRLWVVDLAVPHYM